MVLGSDSTGGRVVMYVSVCVCACMQTHFLFFLHGWFLGTPEPLLWNKAYHWCSSVLLVCVCVCVCSLCFMAMCVTC